MSTREPDRLDFFLVSKTAARQFFFTITFRNKLSSCHVNKRDSVKIASQSE